MSRPWPRPSTLWALLALAACASGSRSGPEARGVRFAIEVGGEGEQPVWVYANTESEPVGWVRASGAAGRLYLEPRCEIPDCGEPAAVCGAALPRVVRVAAAGRAGRVSYSWDGVTSVLDDSDGCERRVPAEAGAYTARFCYAYGAEVDGAGAPAEGVPGRLLDQTCVERPFELGADSVVVLALP